MDLDKNTIQLLKFHTSSLKTDDGQDLFQLIEQSSEISDFVSRVVDEQPLDTLNQLLWHKNNCSEGFYSYLQNSLLCRLFLVKSRCPNVESSLLEDYQKDFRTEQSIMTFLRKTRKQHSAAIAILELNHLITIEESMKRMSQLADGLIQAAYHWSYAAQAANFGFPTNCSAPQSQQNLLILAMGKLGGFELNFSSDIDLIFFYRQEGKTTGGNRSVTHARFFQKVGIQVIKLLDEKSADGFVFRVDMRLRPYGDSGALVMSIDQAEDYYQDQGRGWERFAMVRARIITGGYDEKQLLEGIIRPFAFRRYIDYGVIDSLRNMKEMIQREVRRRGLTDNIKLGAGGIREIEFMVQSLQLIRGGRDKKLQQKSLLKVLPLLVKENLLPKNTADELMSNYLFLRQLENYLQELSEKQTQNLPLDDNDKIIIAKLMKFDEWSSFRLKLENIQNNTHEHFNALFGEEKSIHTESDDFFTSLWEGHIDQQQLSQQQLNLSTEQAKNIIEALGIFRNSSLLKNLSARGAIRLKRFFPHLLSICMNAEAPDETLQRLITILKAIIKRTAYLELLSENLPVLQHLVDLVSKSDWVVKRLADYPILFDELLYPNSLYEPLQASDLINELRQSLLRIEENDEEQLLDAVRRFKQINELRIAAALLSNRIGISQVSRYLTQLAEVIVQSVMQTCWKQMVKKHGEPQADNHSSGNDENLEPLAHSIFSFAVIGYGKLGGYELGFNSDLDLVFLYNRPLTSMTLGTDDKNSKSISVVKFYTRFAQKIIHFLSTRTSLGILYEVDMRLRPSGNSGLLVSHINAFSDYQKESAWTWEHQAIVRARVIAGDPDLSDKFNQVRHNVIKQPRNQEKLKSDIVTMREKMRQEYKIKTSHVNLKQSSGGLIDIEFLAQYFALSFIEDNSSKLNNQSNPPTNTVEILKLARERGQLQKTESKLLIECYRKYRNYLNQQALVKELTRDNVDIFVDERKNVSDIWRKYIV